MYMCTAFYTSLTNPLFKVRFLHKWATHVGHSGCKTSASSTLLCKNIAKVFSYAVSQYICGTKSAYKAHCCSENWALEQYFTPVMCHYTHLPCLNRRTHAVTGTAIMLPHSNGALRPTSIHLVPYRHTHVNKSLAESGFCLLTRNSLYCSYPLAIVSYFPSFSPLPSVPISLQIIIHLLQSLLLPLFSSIWSYMA